MTTNIPQMLREGDGRNEALAEALRNAVSTAARELANNSLHHGLDLSECVMFIFDETMIIENFEEVAEATPVSRAEFMGLSFMLVTDTAMQNFAEYYGLYDLQKFLRLPVHPFAVRLVLMTEGFEVFDTYRSERWCKGGSV